jgi:dolichyl-phosphate-mannose--protein O-mannosyl transferase
MHDRCPVCGLHFNREAGYFLGAMYISYGLALAVIFAIGAALWAVTRWRVDKIALWAVLLFIPFVPMLTFLSRVLWIYLDQKIDPEREP